MGRRKIRRQSQECERCGSSGNVTRHHIYQRYYFGNQYKDAVWMLCASCHTLMHREMDRHIKRIIRSHWAEIMSVQYRFIIPPLGLALP